MQHEVALGNSVLTLGTGDVFVGVGLTIREKRDRLKAKQKKQGGYLSPEDSKELARLRAKIAKDDASSSPFDFIVDAGKAVVHAGESVVHAVSKVPVIGDVTQIVADTYTAPFKLVDSIASGARLDKAALGAIKEQVRIAKAAAPYAQTVVALVPGVGTGVAAAIGAGAALAEGQSITEAAKAAIRGSVPGGALGATAFDTAMKVAAGENVGQAALESARNLVPDGPARQAFDIGVAVATGEKLQNALARGLMNMTSKQIGDLGMAGAKIISSTPGLSDAFKAISEKAKPGFTLAAGLLGQAGINEKALTAVRSKLSSDLRAGFDAALRAQEAHLPWLKNVTNPPPPEPIPTAPPVRLTAAPKPPPAPVRLTAAPKPPPAPVRLTAAPKAPSSAPPRMTAAVPPKAAGAPPSGIVPGEFGPYPTLGVGVGATGAAWRWFVVYANGLPLSQQGPRWLTDYEAARETAGWLESTQGRGYIGSVARWDWDPNLQRWRQAGGTLAGGGGHHGGGHHGGGHGHGGHGGHRFSQRVYAGRQWEPWWGVPWYPDVVERIETCRTWGEPTAMSHSVEVAGKAALGASGGRPTTVRGPDGLLYLFAFENGIMTARPCTATVAA